MTKSKEKPGFKKYDDLMKRLENLNKKMMNNPMLFYGDVGYEAILLTKEIYIEGKRLLRTLQIKKFPLRISILPS